MPAPLLSVTGAQDGRQGAIMTLDQSLSGIGFWTSQLPQGYSNTILLLAAGSTPGLLEPGESEDVPIYYDGWQQPFDLSYPPVQFSVSTITAGSTTPIDWSSLESELQPASASAAGWNAVFGNFVNQVGDTGGSFVTALDAASSYLGQLGEQVSDLGTLVNFEFLQADGGISPLSDLATAPGIDFAEPGLDLTFSPVFPETITSRDAPGPLGLGWTDEWEMSLQQPESGTVVITMPGGAQRTFLADSRGGYFSQPGDYGTLAENNGVFQLTEADGLVETFLPDGLLGSITDTDGNKITLGYNSGSQLTSLTANDNGDALTFAYNAQGDISQITDPSGDVTQFAYDPSGQHLLSITGPDGTTSYQYVTGGSAASDNAVAQLTSVTGAHTFFTYDSSGRVIGSQLDNGTDSYAYAYPGEGVIQITDDTNATTTLSLDQFGLLARARTRSGTPAR